MLSAALIAVVALLSSCNPLAKYSFKLSVRFFNELKIEKMFSSKTDWQFVKTFSMCAEPIS